MAQRQHFSLRLSSDTLDRLTEQAAMRGLTKTALAEAFLREAVIMAEHPGIVFRDGPTGRRAGVVGGPDVWELIETFLDEGRDATAAARYLSLPVGLVQAAVEYYLAYPAEVDARIARNAAAAERAEAAWRGSAAVR